MSLDQDSVNQKRYQRIAADADLNNPEMMRILQLLSRSLLNRPFESLSPDAQHNIKLLASATAGSLNITSLDGSKGLDAMTKSLMSNPVLMRDISGNRIGQASGPGNLTFGAASSLYSQLGNRINSTNGIDTGITGGLSSQAAMQVAAKQVARTSISSHSVYLGKGSAGLSAAMDNMRRLGADMQSKEIKELENVAKLSKAREEFTAKGLTGERLESNMEAHAKSLGISDKAMQMEQAQSRGQLSMPVIAKDTVDKIAKATAKVTGNIKQLADIFGTEDIDMLQNFASQINLGDIADPSNIHNVRSRLQNISARAAVSGRSIQEVIAEQANVVQALSSTYGGSEFVNGKAIEYVQGVRSNAEQQRLQGVTGGLTVDEAVAASQRSLDNANQHFSGIAVLEKAVKEGGANLRGEPRRKAVDIQARFEKAAREGDRAAMRKIAVEAQSFAESIDSNASNETYKRDALKDSKLDLGRMSVESALPQQARDRAAKEFKKYKNQEGTLANAFLKRGDTTGQLFKDLQANLVKTTGGDQKATDALQEDLESVNAKGTEAGKQDQLKAIIARMRRTGMNEDDINTHIGSLNTLARLDVDTQKRVLGQHRTRQKSDAQLVQTESGQQRLNKQLEVVAARDKLMQDSYDGISKEGSSFLAGLAGGSTGISREAAAAAHVWQLNGQASNDTIQLGATDGGRFKDKAKLLKDRKFLISMNVDPNNKTAVENLSKRLDQYDAVDYVQRTLEEQGMVGAKNDKGEYTYVNGDVVDEKQRKLTEEHKAFQGLQGLVSLGKGADGKATYDTGGQSFTSIQDATKHIMDKGTAEQRKQLMQAQKNGNEAVGAAIKDYDNTNLYTMYHEMENVAESLDDNRSNGEWKKSIEGLKDKSSVEQAEFLSKQTGIKDLSLLIGGGKKAKMRLMQEGVLDEKGKFKTGQFQGTDYEEFHKNLNKNKELKKVIGNLAAAQKEGASAAAGDSASATTELLQQILDVVRNKLGN